ncbi:unnamed protein product [Parnassius apollo]|uniref:(apollo) hypothetical protein n=1 Tax=Parnassius apollo TaxID=110799 RepID=A0A8S3XDL6_PARAO|nr:unnamed protein product [Parnassius apollo]
MAILAKVSKLTKSIEKSGQQIKRSQLSAPRKTMGTSVQGAARAARGFYGAGARAACAPSHQQPATRRQPPAARRLPLTNQLQNYHSCR